MFYWKNMNVFDQGYRLRTHGVKGVEINSIQKSEWSDTGIVPGVFSKGFVLTKQTNNQRNCKTVCATFQFLGYSNVCVRIGKSSSSEYIPHI